MPLGLLLLIVYVGVFVLLFAVVFSLIAMRKVRGVRRPVKERMLRPAGTSLSERVDELSENMFIWYMMAIFVPVGVASWTALGLSLMAPVPASTAWAAVTLALVTFILPAWPLVEVARRLSNYRLGLSGERAVAEQLQELVRMGCYVFHDLQPDKTWNIDHIVVAPDSVLVVETKTRRMRGRENGKAAHEVVFDGRELHFPNWSDRHGLQQAERNASWVRDFLGKALGERVKVEPVLALPGWMVKRKGRGAVYVVNPKEIRALVRARGIHAITPEQEKRMKQIAFALEQKCRDVEF